jgi:glycosyltransferase involved in cell wall biosynthesis
MADHVPNLATAAPRVSVVVPVYNAESTLRELADRIFKALAPWAPIELVFVDDCSRDMSWIVIKDIARSNPNVLGISLMRNFGQTGATFAGLRYSRGEVIVTIDDDLQNPPEEIPKLLQVLEKPEELDFVNAVPDTKQHSRWRNIASVVVNYLNRKIFSQNKGFKLTSFRAMRRTVIEPLFELNIPEPAIGALLMKITSRVGNVTVEHRPRSRGRSNYNLFKMFELALTRFLGFTSLPLRLIAGLGLIGLIVSIMLSIYVLTIYLIGDVKVPGWASVTLVLLMISAFQFLSLGVIGEYLHQILWSVRQSPSFIIRRTTLDSNSSIDRDVEGSAQIDGSR